MAEPTRRHWLATSLTAVAGAGAATVGRHATAAGLPNTAEPATPLTLGLTTYMFLHYSLDQTLAMARRVAVRPVCIRRNLLPLDSSDAQIEAAMAKVKAAGLVPYGGGVVPLRTEAQVRRAFAYARAAGFPLLSVTLPPALLPALQREVRKHDIRAAIHNHGPGDKHWPHPLAIHERIRDLDQRIGICHDTGHTLRTGLDPTEALLRTADRHLDIHLKDVDSATATGHSTELGRGVADLPRFLRALRRTAASAIVGIEYEKHMKDLLPGLAESVGYARGVLDALG